MKDKTIKRQKEKPKEIKEEEQKPFNIYNNSRSYLRVGEIELGSDYLPPDNLVSLLVWLLKQTSVKKYLGIIKFKKNNGGSYLG